MLGHQVLDSYNKSIRSVCLVLWYLNWNYIELTCFNVLTAWKALLRWFFFYQHRSGVSSFHNFWIGKLFVDFLQKIVKRQTFSREGEAGSLFPPIYATWFFKCFSTYKILVSNWIWCFFNTFLIQHMLLVCFIFSLQIARA